MRLIDADRLKRDWRMGDMCEECTQDSRECQRDYCYTKMDVCEMIDDAPTVGVWVSVEDRVPESNEIVLVYAYDENGDGYMAMAVRYPCGDWDSEDDYFNQMESEVRYWMPLPEPPKEG